MIYSYNRNTTKPWIEYFHASRDDNLQGYASSLDFAIEFSYYMSPDPTPFFVVEPEYEHTV